MAIDKTAHIHESAVVSRSAEIGAGTIIGPFSVVGDEVRLGRNVHLKSHVIIDGNTQIGDDTVIFPFACLGEAPENKRSPGHDTRLIIGARNQIREGVTINRGTEIGGGLTQIGDDCFFMAKSHIGHDCIIANKVMVAPQAAIAGHCVIGDEVIISGLSGVHQFTELGRGCFIGAMSKAIHDVIPYGLVDGAQGELIGLNLKGLRRTGLSNKNIAALRAGFDFLRDGAGNFKERAQSLFEATDNEWVKEIAQFIVRPGHKREFLIPKKKSK